LRGTKGSDRGGAVKRSEVEETRDMVTFNLGLEEKAAGVIKRGSRPSCQVFKLWKNRGHRLTKKECWDPET